MITPTQSKMARAALDWGIRDLARQAAVGVSTVTRFENGQGEPIPATVQAIKHALEAEGVRFTEYGVEMPATSQIAGNHPAT